MIAAHSRAIPQGVVSGPASTNASATSSANIYAFTSDGLTPRQLRDRVEDIRAKVLPYQNVARSTSRSGRDEKIFLWKFSPGRSRRSD